MIFHTLCGRPAARPLLLLLAPPALLLPPVAGAAELRLQNAAEVALVHVHAVAPGQAGDGPDHLDGQAVAPGEEVRITLPGDACRLRLRLVWLDGASTELPHDACADNGPIAVRIP